VVVDTSAVLAMLVEPDGEPYFAALRNSARPTMSAVSVYEARVILSGTHLGRPRFPPDATPRFMEWLRVNGVEVVPFDIDQAILAHRAYLRFGKGLHPAALNLVDCVAYALATSRGSRSCSRATTSPERTSSRP
jgi:ribonuclease VapC